MKIKNKGKVHPSPSSDGDYFDVFSYLPAAIFALVSAMALDDREVLAFMMRRSTETSSPSSSASEKKFSKRVSKKPAAPRASSGSACVHAPPSFHCLDCYMSYWDRWNSSPSRELIDRAIEAFEEQLANGEKSGKNVKGKRRDKICRRSSENPVTVAPPPLPEVLPLLTDEVSVAPGTSVSNEVEVAEGSGEPSRTEEESAAVVIVPSPPSSNHKGLARKVWPDVLGLFNSRLWRLWGPN